jgi:hypothetical protein
MLYWTGFSACSEINKNQINTVWAECGFLGFKPVGACNQKAFKVNWSRKSSFLQKQETITVLTRICYSILSGMYSFHASLSLVYTQISHSGNLCHILRIKLFMHATAAATGTTASVNGTATATANITSQNYRKTVPKNTLSTTITTAAADTTTTTTTVTTTTTTLLLLPLLLPLYYYYYYYHHYCHYYYYYYCFYFSIWMAIL